MNANDSSQHGLQPQSDILKLNSGLGPKVVAGIGGCSIAVMLAMFIASLGAFDSPDTPFLARFLNALLLLTPSALLVGLITGICSYIFKVPDVLVILTGFAIGLIGLLSSTAAVQSDWANNLFSLTLFISLVATVLAIFLNLSIAAVRLLIRISRKISASAVDARK